jgi:hypothetical protein
MTTAQKRRQLTRAAQALYARHPELFVGGCGVISTLIVKLARSQHLAGVAQVFGWFDFQHPEPDDEGGWAHAWNTIDGQRFDPAHDVPRYDPIRYHPDPRAGEVVHCQLDPAATRHYLQLMRAALHS